jgi:uncharacterized protein YggE
MAIIGVAKNRKDSVMRRLSPAVAAFALALVAAAPSDAAAPGTLSVSGQGEMRAAPDQAILSTGVATTAPTAAAALSENAAKMNAVFATLKRLGVPDKSIQTSNFTVSPQYPPYNANETGVQRIVGYQVSNQVSVTLDDPKKLGPTLDALVAAGSNQINSVGFVIRDTAELLTKARAAAVADAIARAHTYAAAAGVTLGPVLSIQEGSGEGPRPVFETMVAAQRLAAPTPTAPGEQSVSANVTVVFSISTP